MNAGSLLKGKGNESSIIGQKTLRALQNHPAQRRHPGDLQQEPQS